MRKIKCSNPKCDGVFAHLLGNKTLDLKRQKQQVIVAGSDFNIYATCGKCGEKTTVYVENNRIVEDDIEFHEDGILTDEQKAELERQKQERIAQGLDTEEDGLKGKNKPPVEEEEPELDENGNPVKKPASFLDRNKKLPKQAPVNNNA